jgi:hypothetical protein
LEQGNREEIFPKKKKYYLRITREKGAALDM